MFTVEEIKAAHSKVRSGADFPAYIKEIKTLGVACYDAYVTDGHIDYHGVDGYIVSVPVKYGPLAVAATVSKEAFVSGLKAHQQGKTDFMAFVAMSAAAGVERWQVCMKQMSCTYYDRQGVEVLVENIPDVR